MRTDVRTLKKKNCSLITFFSRLNLINSLIKTKQAIEYIIEAWKQVKKINYNQLLEKGGFINFIFSFTEKETDEQTTMSNIDEIKADFISMYEIIKSLDKYKSAVDLQKRLKNRFRKRRANI